MKRIINLSFLLCSVLISTGCASYHIRPAAASIAVPKSSGPIPVTVGISRVDQKLTGGFSDLLPGFKERLEESGLFQTVYYPLRSDDKIDGGINLTIRTEFKMDPVWFPKAFFTGFFMFVPTPITWYNHEYHADCTLELARDGKPIKTYTSKQIVTASMQLFAPPTKVEAEGTDAAARKLSADLIQQLLNDRGFIQHEFGATRQVSLGQEAR